MREQPTMIQPISQDVADEPHNGAWPALLPVPARLRGPCWAHACRDGEVICSRVELSVTADTRLGLAPRERRQIAARFVEHLHPTLRTELSELVRRRGAAARRLAGRMDPIELVFDESDGSLQRIIGWIQPPQVRHGRIREIEFGLRESAP
jgi:hypothetical protein